MLYAKIENGEVTEYPINERQLRQEKLPNLSLPQEITDESLEGTGWVCVDVFSSVDIPEETETHTLALSTPVLTEVGWERTWTQIPVAPENIEARKRFKLKEIRAKRDILMARADKLVMRYHRETRLGVPHVFELDRIDTYIQALADITNQDNLWNITWPEL